VKQYKTKYGSFSADGKEYVITTPETPRPWTNILTNGDYGVIVSQSGSGYSWRSNAQLNRISRWEQDLIKDEWGKYIYIRDNDSEKFWSAGWKPVCADPDRYLCRHGIGYTAIESLTNGIEAELLMFVPNDVPLEVITLKLVNRTKKTRHLSLFSYLEWNLGAAPDWHREFHKCFINTHYDPALNAVVATKRLWEVPSTDGHWNRNWEYAAFHSCSVKPSSFDADKESFMGMYGTLRAPKSVAAGALKKNSGNSLDAIASLKVNVTLKPGEEKEIVFLIGAADSQEEIAPLVKRFHSLKEVHAAFDAMKRKWDAMLGTVTVDTPDDSMNLMLNTYLKYQAIAGRLWGRTGYYQTGGAFGFRDQLQDSQIFLPIDPSQTKKQIMLHAKHQFKDGTVYHWWHPLSESGLPTEMTDDLLWLPFVVHEYVAETDDLAVLDETASFLDDKEPRSLYEHCTRAIDKVLTRFSERGLPLIGAGDWNDGLSAVGLQWKGESIWLGQFLHRILHEFAFLASRYGDELTAARYRGTALTLKQAINEHGWDGDYYFGATKDSGEKLGSKSCTEGRLWLNTQTWAVIADIADTRRATHVMDVVENKLEFKNGPVLLHPAYSTPDTKIGYLSRYSPGMRENGGVYTHAATWAIMAEAKLGRADAAFRMFCELNPIVNGAKPDEYLAEPYVTPGNIDGPNSVFYGRGGWTWYTGSAAWLFKAGLEWILGVRAHHNGLVVHPCIPSAWKKYSVVREFRGITYTIHVKNPKHVSGGIAAARIDGAPTPVDRDGRLSVLLPLFPAGTAHTVEIVLGK
jgi:cellobiose phosphorylase